MAAEDSSDYPMLLTEMTEQDLVGLLAEYVRASDSIRKADADFIEAIKRELKARSGRKRLQVDG